MTGFLFFLLNLAIQGSAHGWKGTVGCRPQTRATHLPVGEVEVFMHVHLWCERLQTVQAHNAVLGASDSDVINCEEPAATGIRLVGEAGQR